MDSTPKPNRKVAFVAWRRLSRRTTLMCKALNVDLWFYTDRLPYLKAAFKTFAHVRKYRPSVLLIQLPQGPLLLQALLLRFLFGCRVIADVHTGFLMDWEWKSYFLNAPFRNLLSHADYIVIHNNTIKKLLSESAKRKALIVYDPWPYIDLSTNQRDGDYLVFPASYHPDEPLKEILDCARNNFPNVQLYVTGDWRRHPSVKQYESKNIVFTSYLSEKGYDDLISGARGIITGTKEEYTILMSAWEAVAYKKPLAITKTLALRDTYAEYPVYYDWKDQRSISLAMQSLLSQSQFKDNTALREKVLQSMTEFKEKISLLLS